MERRLKAKKTGASADAHHGPFTAHHFFYAMMPETSYSQAATREKFRNTTRDADCALATGAYVLETIRGAVSRLLKKIISNCTYQYHYYHHCYISIIFCQAHNKCMCCKKDNAVGTGRANAPSTVSSNVTLTSGCDLWSAIGQGHDSYKQTLQQSDTAYQKSL